MLSRPMSRCGVRPIRMALEGLVQPSAATHTSAWGNQAYRSGPIAGMRTPRKRPNATATAAMVPVPMTTKKVQP